MFFNICKYIYMVNYEYYNFFILLNPDLYYFF